jgi:hypothetical protein
MTSTEESEYLPETSKQGDEPYRHYQSALYPTHMQGHGRCKTRSFPSELLYLVVLQSVSMIRSYWDYLVGLLLCRIIQGSRPGAATRIARAEVHR